MKKANRLGKRRETRQKDESWFQVRSQTSSFDLWHDIILTEYGLRCDCPEYSNSNLKCKHIFAIENAYPHTRSTTVDIIPKQKVEINKIIDPIPASRCRKCGTTDIKRDGVRKNNNQIVQKYKCNICNAFFQITLDSKTCMHGRNAVICSSFVRLAECTPLLKIELFGAGHDECRIRDVMDHIVKNSVNGYPYSLRMAHDTCKVSGEDMRRFSHMYGLCNETGSRDVLR